MTPKFMESSLKMLNVIIRETKKNLEKLTQRFQSMHDTLIRDIKSTKKYQTDILEIKTL